MCQELKDFEYFQDYQLHAVDFTTGRIDAHKRNRNLVYQDIGSLNPDGYVRVWCNGKLRMKHRLLYFLYHGELPTDTEEIDHYDGIRDHNFISNLRVLTKSENNKGCANRKFTHFSKEVIHMICAELSGTDLSDQAIAEKLNVSRCTVRDIKTRKSRQAIACTYEWSHRGY
jgi:hypothetical protein